MSTDFYHILGCVVPFRQQKALYSFWQSRGPPLNDKHSHIMFHNHFHLLAVFCPMQLTTTNDLNIHLCYRHVYSMVSGVWSWQKNMPTDLSFLYLLSLRDLMRHWHTCKQSPAGLLLMSRPPCESTLSLSRPIILEQYWLLMCLSTRPRLSSFIIRQTNNPLYSSLVIIASNTPLV